VNVAVIRLKERQSCPFALHSPTVTELGEKIERLEARVELLEGLDRHVKQPPEKLDVFKAVVQQSTRGLPNVGYYGDFTTKGPVTASLKSLPRNIGEVVSDGTGKLLFGMGGHELYRLDLSKRKATEIVATGVPEISCAMGLAYDTKRERVVLATLGGEGFLYGYDHKKDSWAVVSSMQLVRMQWVRAKNAPFFTSTMLNLAFAYERCQLTYQSSANSQTGHFN